MTAVVRDVTEAEFTSEVLERSRSRPVVVDFWAAWCGPCRQLSPLLERVAERYAGDVDVVKVDVDAAQGLSRQLRIQGIPAVKAFKDGRVVSEFTGLRPEAAIDAFFAALAPSEADRLVAQASLEGTSDEDREHLLRSALEREPAHIGAIVALGRLLGARGDLDAAESLLSKAQGNADVEAALAEVRLASAASSLDVDDLRGRADAGDTSARLALGRALAGRGAAEEALEHLLVAAADPEVREDARVALVELFRALGDDHAVTRAGRPRLARTLF